MLFVELIGFVCYYENEKKSVSPLMKSQKITEEKLCAITKQKRF